MAQMVRSKKVTRKINPPKPKKPTVKAPRSMGRQAKQLDTFLNQEDKKQQKGFAKK